MSVFCAADFKDELSMNGLDQHLAQPTLPLPFEASFMEVYVSAPLTPANSTTDRQDG